MPQTTVGHSTARTLHIVTQCERIINLCTTGLATAPDVFGEIETVAGRNDAIARAANMLSKVAAMTDADWDELMATTAAEVREADHPKHSVIR